MSVKREEIGDATPVRRTIIGAFALMVGGPTAFLAALSVRYSLVGPACEIGVVRLLLEASTLIGLLAALGAFGWGVRALRASAPEELFEQKDQPRFVAAFSLLTGALFLLTGITLWLPSLFLSPCGRP